jgi:WD40 repeat protein
LNSKAHWNFSTQGDCEESVHAVAVSRNGQWAATGGRDRDRAELKACEVEMGIIKTLKGHSNTINCIDISNNTLLASGSSNQITWIWNLDTSKLVAGPFKSRGYMGAVRFFKSFWGLCLEEIRSITRHTTAGVLDKQKHHSHIQIH